MTSVRRILAIAWMAGTACSSAQAQLTQYHEQHAAACHPRGTTVKGLSYGTNGILNQGDRSRDVICPLDRLEELQDGSLIVYVDGKLTAGGTISCTLQSWSQWGVYLGGDTNTSSGAQFSVLLALPASEVPPESYQSFVCTLPPGGDLVGYFADF